MWSLLLTLNKLMLAGTGLYCLNIKCLLHKNSLSLQKIGRLGNINLINGMTSRDFEI